MPLVDRVLSIMHGQRASILGTCIVCHRMVHAGPEGLRLPRNTAAHRRCATYRMRRLGVSQRLTSHRR